MRSLDTRLNFLEAARATARQLDHLTDAELDERIAVLLAQLHPMAGQLPTKGNTVSNNERSISSLEGKHAKP